MRRLAAGAALVALPALAWAHAGHVRLSSVEEALAYYFTSAELLATVAVAIAAGLNGSAAVRGSLATLPLGLIAGLGTALAIGFEPPVARTASISLLFIGALAAWSPRCSPVAIAALAGAAAWLHSWLVATAAAGAPAVATVAMAVTAMALFALVAHGASRMRAQWARIAFRVAGSWIAAVGLLMLGRSLSGA